ncbi:MAG: phosphoenolpyruvate--protein phosphotransferase [Chloroflexi bacterium]|nr:phosphoenolpyruvate--protein phosphotransferase [Chloroflexota bacterium]
MKTIQGIGASAGFAVGPVFLYTDALPSIEPKRVDSVEAELVRLRAALERVGEKLEALETETAAKVGKAEAEVFAAHRLFLVDPSFTGEIEKSIHEHNIQAEAAVQGVALKLRETFEAMQDDYFRARAADIMDVGGQVIRELMGISARGLEQITSPVIVLADELVPSATARMDASLVLGLVTSRGGKSGHAAILARSLGIPAIVGAGPEILKIDPGASIIIDGGAGTILLEADPQIQQEYLQRKKQQQARLSHALTNAAQPAVTLDGVRVEVAGNIGSMAEAGRVVEFGGEGVGLLRTEFLFLDRLIAPSEEEQFQTYAGISDKLGNRPLIIRTLDVGGDKPLPYLPVSSEDNPFLGNRGVRLCLGRPDLFKIQLRAILRAAHGREIRIMFPMVTTVGEVRAARALIAEARDEIVAAGGQAGTPQVGIMVEVPAAALTSDLLAAEVDFFSIGTNDLTQYTLAVDRTNPSVQNIADHFHPSVLRLIRLTIQQAHERGVWVGLCGELAGDPLATPLLLGMGLDEFSMSSASIPFVKGVIRRWSREEAAALVDSALGQEDAQAVVAFLQQQKKPESENS